MADNRYVVISGLLYWTGNGWAPCQYCAKRLSKAAAHEVACYQGTSRRVKKIVPKKK